MAPFDSIRFEITDHSDWIWGEVIDWFDSILLGITDWFGSLRKKHNHPNVQGVGKDPVIWNARKLLFLQRHQKADFVDMWYIQFVIDHQVDGSYQSILWSNANWHLRHLLARNAAMATAYAVLCVMMMAGRPSKFHKLWNGHNAACGSLCVTQSNVSCDVIVLPGAAQGDAKLAKMLPSRRFT